MNKKFTISNYLFLSGNLRRVIYQLIPTYFVADQIKIKVEIHQFELG